MPQQWGVRFFMQLEQGVSMIYGYARVSSGDQDLTVQRNALKAAGCEVIREEKASGKSREGREQLQILMDFVREGDTLVVTKLDRLARNTLDMLDIIQQLGDRGVGFKSLAEPWADTTSPAGKLMLTVMAGVATFERERIRERQLEGIARAKENGVYKGGKPKFSPEDIAKLQGEGLGVSQIAKRLGCSRQTVYRLMEV